MIGVRGRGTSSRGKRETSVPAVPTSLTPHPGRLQFVAHPNVQQLLAAIWYDGLPGFRRKSMVGQLMEVAKLGAMFPVLSTIYMFAPTSEKGQFMKKPFVKFICHSASYGFFLSK